MHGSYTAGAIRCYTSTIAVAVPDLAESLVLIRPAFSVAERCEMTVSIKLVFFMKLACVHAIEPMARCRRTSFVHHKLLPCKCRTIVCRQVS